MKNIFFGLVLFFLTNEVFAQEKPEPPILSNCSTDKDTQKTTCHAVIKYPKVTYEGELITSNCKEEKKNIICIANFKSSNDVLNYEGQIINGLPAGRAVIKYGNGNRFEGIVEEYGLKLNGNYYFKSGSVWTGVIKDEKMQGKGVYLYANGDKFEGDFNGHGTLFLKDSIAKGEFKNTKLINGIILEYSKDLRAIYLEGKNINLYLAEKEIANLENKCSQGSSSKDFEKNSTKYYKCLVDEGQLLSSKKEKEKQVLANKQKIALEKKEKEEQALVAKQKIALEKKEKEEQALVAKQNEAAEKKRAEQQKNEAKIANMKPEERRAYICENTYGFRKGSNKFSECVYKIMNAEVELEKLELQKKLSESQKETARANEAAARANASRNSAPTYDPNVAAAMERTNEIERARILLNLGQALRTPVSPQSSAPVPQTNCRVARGGYINCW
jgi:hypothetical protein